MEQDQTLTASIYEGWHAYQEVLTGVLTPLDPDQLALRAAPNLRSVGEIGAHMVGARARWFYQLMGEGGEEFKALGRWDHRGAKARSAEELIIGLGTTWSGMQKAIIHWTPDDWQKTWSAEYEGEPERITRQWVIWHLIEHDLHHGGEISITHGANGVPGLQL